MAHKVILPPQKNYIPQFLKQRDINSYNTTLCGLYKASELYQSAGLRPILGLFQNFSQKYSIKRLYNSCTADSHCKKLIEDLRCFWYVLFDLPERVRCWLSPSCVEATDTTYLSVAIKSTHSCTSFSLSNFLKGPQRENFELPFYTKSYPSG